MAEDIARYDLVRIKLPYQNDRIDSGLVHNRVGEVTEVEEHSKGWWMAAIDCLDKDTRVAFTCLEHVERDPVRRAVRRRTRPFYEGWRKVV